MRNGIIDVIFRHHRLDLTDLQDATHALDVTALRGIADLVQHALHGLRQFSGVVDDVLAARRCGCRGA